MVGGIDDLRAMTVSGFGVGYTRISVATGKRSGAAPRLLKSVLALNEARGTIDRLSGTKRIIVRSTKEPQTMLIRMELDCRPVPLTGY